MKPLIKKQKDHAFGNDAYLLGKDEYGIKYWLKSPSWDCGWYWGFGYVETYQQNWAPSKARDINSHTHINSSFCRYVVNGNYIHNIYDCPTLATTTFTKGEGWELSELFAQFYTLKESAELFHKGKSNVSSTTVVHYETVEIAEKINKEMIPAITARIIEILTPQEL